MSFWTDGYEALGGRLKLACCKVSPMHRVRKTCAPGEFTGNDHYRLIMASKENVVEQCARRDRDYIFDEESDVSSIEAEGDVFGRRIQATFKFKK